MTPRQRRFVDEFSLTGNGTQAAIAAGYAARSARQIATENLTKPAVQRALAERQKEFRGKFELSRQRLVEELTQAVEVAKAQGDPLAMVAAWREIAKVCGYYGPQSSRVVLGKLAFVVK